ncbi:methyltransferase domain-containing protein [Aureisphaera galaxeae]|uniref:SAM-dependent methyltransferase n=1 Tax=Aureisphaera galaxeae TaxID=1538023 RepID=UPI002350875E|nr:class I SAM-dependent methyltransferase [Aureisphaera galaxeae]MDC8005619.1 methyltransferase domain-containing protein [Aureisphaera galaxeae]
MKTTTLPFQKKQKINTASQRDIIHFYDEATEDYEFWSKDLNMHFGYFIWGKTNPFKRDSMLNEMNDQIYKRLMLDGDHRIVADLGCGMGGTMRHFLKKDRLLSMIGVTLSPFQVKEGNQLLKQENGIILEEDYSQTSIPTDSMDGVVGIESLCHSGHNLECLREGYRILKKGSKMVIGDAFLKKPPSQLCLGSRYSYNGLCKGWSLSGLGVIHEVEDRLKQIGFSYVKVEEVSFRVAPSVLHVPFAIVGFLMKNLWKGKPIKPQSWNNLKASFYSLVSGLHMKDFGYYIITATK